MAYQFSASSSVKRFVTVSQADIIQIRQDRHEERTKNTTKWAVNLFNGKSFMIYLVFRVLKGAPAALPVI